MNLLNSLSSRIVRICVFSSLFLIGLFSIPIAKAAPPAGFAVEQLLTGLQQPMAMRFLPDERVFVAQKKGVIRIADVFSLPIVDDIYMDLSNTTLHPAGLNSGNERGILDICLDPNFPTEAWVYVLYTPENAAAGEIEPKMRVSRFPHLENAGGATSRADMANEEILWQDSEGYDSCCHFGGGLDFGPDGNLWFTTGDHFQGAYAASITRAGGGVHRITKTGAIPADNPFNDGAGPNIDSLVAIGLRNPFRSRWDLQSNRFMIGEVGGNVQDISWEDIHVITWDAATSRIVDADFGTAADNGTFDGVNFGWPTCEGLAPHTDFPGCAIDNIGEPIFAYAHNNDTAAVTGGVFNREVQFPQEYEGAYFYADSTRDFIRYLKFNTDGSLAPNPAPDPITPLNPDALSYSFDLDPTGRIVALEMGPDGALYFVNFTDAGGAFGQDNPTVNGSVGRYVFDGGNNRPVVTTFESNFTPGSSPISVSFEIEATEPEGTPMTYFIDYGDGQNSGVAQSLAEATPVTLSHTYTTDGIFEAILSISDGSRTTTTRLNVQIGTPPVITSLTSTNNRVGSQDEQFRFGDTIRFEATATDLEDGPMGAANFTWNVQFIRPGNVHPAFGPETNLPLLDFEIPVQGQGFRGAVFYRCFLTVTDSSGLSSTQVIDIDPEKVNIMLDTNPSGIFVQVDGNLAEQTPFTLDTLINFPHQISVPGSQCLNGFSYEFNDWSNGGTDNPLPFPAPVADVTLTANFTNVGECLEPPTAGLALHLKGNDGVVLTGGDVGAWLDQTPNGNNLIAVGEPSLEAGALNGQSYISFDGNDDSLEKLGAISLPAGADDRSIFILTRYRQNSLGVGWAGFTYGNSVENEAFGLTLTPSNTLGLQGWGEENDFQADPPINAIGRWINQGVIYSGGNFVQYDNGTVISSGTHTFNTVNDYIRLGEELSGGKNLAMDVAEILVYNRAVTEAERQQIEAYFEENYQLDVTRGAFPVVTITAPGNSETYSTGDLPLVLSATATDVEDGDLSSAIVWSSDLDGFLGTGAALPATLSVGVHTLTATVTDSDQLDVTSEVAILVSDGSAMNLVTDGLVLQLESDLNVGLQSGSTVAAWLDQSGLGNDLIAGGDPQFVSTSTPAGLPSIAFDGTGDKLERVHLGEPISGLPLGAGARSMFIVVNYQGASAWAGAAYGNGTNNEAFGLVARDDGPQDLILQGWGGGNDFLSGEPAASAGWLVQSALYDGGVSTLFKNGFSVGEFIHVFDTTLNKIVLGEEIAGAGFATMDLAAVLIYDRELTSSERLTVESYLQNKYLQPPVPKDLNINTPTNGASFFQGSTVSFTANLTDLPATTTVEWSSSLNGALGAGESLDVSTLFLGSHTITASAVDNGTVLETDTVNITIEALNSAPTVVIGAPQDGVMTFNGTVINFVGGALDPEDGNLGSSIIWSSNLDGVLGTGVSLSTALTSGSHIVTASVTDSGSKTSSRDILVSVSSNNPGNLITSGLVTHFESDSLVTVQSGTTTVTDWNDLTSSANNLSASGDPQLISNSTPTGMPALQFDGVDDKLERLNTTDPVTGLSLASADRTMILVARYNSTTAWGGAGYGSGAVNQAFGLGVRHPSGELIIQGWGGGNDYISNSQGLTSGWLTQSVVLDANVATLYKCGLPAGSFAHNYNTSLERIFIAEEPSGAGFIGMDVAAFLIYDRALTAAELADVEAYLETKYLRTSNINTSPNLEISLPPEGEIFDDNEVIQLFATASNLPSHEALSYEPVEDAYLQNGANRDDDDLRILTSARGPIASRIGYLQFDLSGLDPSSAPESVTLTLTESMDVSASAVTLNLYRASSNNWLEETIDFSSAPSKGLLVDSFTGSVADGDQVSFDLSTEVSNPGVYSFILEMEDTDPANDVAFFSKDDPDPAAIAPTLTVIMPEAVNVIQWSSSLDGSLGIGNAISVQGLSVGEHVITAQVSSGGANPTLLTDSINLTVINQQVFGLPVSGGLVLHLESSEGISVVEGITSDWIDLSTEGNTLSPSGDPEVILSATPSGLAAVRLDGNGDKFERLSSASAINGLSAGSSDRTMFIVANYLSSSTFAGASYGSAANNQAYGMITTSGLDGKLAVQGYGPGRDLVSSEIGNGAGWLVQSGIVSGNQSTLYFNGNQIDQFDTTYNTVIDKIVVGEEIGGAGFVEMDVAAVLVYDRALSPSQRVSVENYLQQKYLSISGISLGAGNIPEITSAVSGPIQHEVGSECVDPGATMLDAEDGLTLLASSTQVDGYTIGSYAFTYEGTDSDGNNANSMTIQVEVVDTTPAKILVPQDGPILRAVGAAFVDPGAVAVDAVDSPVALASSTTVNGLVAGTYFLTYDHTDNAGNSSPTKVVEVRILDLKNTPYSLSPSNDPIAADDLMISFDSERGFSYSVQSSLDMVTWTTIAIVSGGNLTETIMQEDGLSENAYFYRIAIQTESEPAE